MLPVENPKEERIDPDEPPSLEEQAPLPIEQKMKAYWVRWLPALVAGLRKQGGEAALEQAIRRAWWQVEFQVSLTMARNPALHRLQAEELFLDQLYPPPEPSTIRGLDRATTS